ncbi:ORF-58 [Catopsilia pomona nucleopolyhedrovirus]|uniref:ORF-58 n=1 Tax=Catopsilia pomona nucleopolyhedrovirus TaxID=1850906 RepID=A0A172WZC9_9ABAC|nr:ORF-58 [Catopsilia pomona nucleopolyhedrovirus]ANF29706.1 ORF-58 [Catopsilia pomona nucleopolyhedrovirus]
MKTRRFEADKKLFFMNALGLQRQSQSKIIAHKVLLACNNKWFEKYKQFKGVNVVKNELKKFNLNIDQYNETLYQCWLQDKRWCETDNWNWNNDTNTKYIYNINFNSKTKIITENYYTIIQCYVKC